MLYLKALALGILEGITEFIPVSSTGHLIIMSAFLNFDIPNHATFDISIQLGAIIAVITLYWGFFKKFLSLTFWFSEEAKRCFIAILPILILGFFMKDFIKLLFIPEVVVISLLVGGFVMIIVEKFINLKLTTNSIEKMTKKQSLIIGLFQCAALIPGMSRSGSTIIGALISGLNYKSAAEFSFIIAVPVMIVATTYELITTASSLTILEIKLIGIGFVTSFLVAYISIISFLKILQKLKLTPFGIYRILLACLYVIFVIL